MYVQVPYLGCLCTSVDVFIGVKSNTLTYLFTCLSMQICNQPIRWQQLKLQKFELNIRMKKKGDLSSFGCGMLVPDGLLRVSGTAGIFTENHL